MNFGPSHENEKAPQPPILSREYTNQEPHQQTKIEDWSNSPAGKKENTPKLRKTFFYIYTHFYTSSFQIPTLIPYLILKLFPIRPTNIHYLAIFYSSQKALAKEVTLLPLLNLCYKIRQVVCFLVIYKRAHTNKQETHTHKKRKNLQEQHQ